VARTHDVLNQPPPLEGRNLFDDNVALVEALEREGGGWALERCRDVGAVWGGDPVRWGFEANEHPPRLRAFDRYGHRVDEVEFHRAWHDLMALAVSHELHSLPWTSASPGAHVARTAMYLTATQPEGGFACPITMTFAAVPALRAQPELAAEWEPRLTATSYEPSLDAAGKRSALCGMAMTEKQGGSDVRANTTVAVPADGAGGDPGAEYELTGHKWFCSAPMCDLFLVLAQTPDGLSCFALPRVLPDGTRNAMHLQRLKDKLGNRSNASSEIELLGARARMVGEPGRGVPTILEMVGHTRLDCVIGTAAGMRWGVANATWHAAHRSAFGALLADQPLMRNVLADLCVESEAATALAMRLARAYDEAAASDAQGFKRLATAIAKYHVCKRGPGHAFEALECLGGNGYVEESGMPRLYREMPLGSIWEGSGNVMALDVLRTLARTPGVLDAFFDELAEASGADPRLDAFCARLRAQLSDADAIEARARRVVEHMALALQGSLLVRHAPAAVADAFCASRLAGDGGLAYGTLPAGVDHAAIIERHTPA